MNTMLQMLLTIHLSLGLLEMIFFQFCAVLLGFCIHFFIVSRRNTVLPKKNKSPYAISEADEWKLKYFDESEKQEKKYQDLTDRLETTVRELENTEMELETTQLENLKLHKEQARLQSAELAAAQLEETIELIKQKDVEILQLKDQMEKLRKRKAKSAGEPEAESGMKISTSTINLDALQVKLESLHNENQQLLQLVADKETKLHAFNFQRQQLMRKITLLEDLNNDIRQLGDPSSALHEETTTP
ncbi:hypothetical protein [Pinibacter aurantiacus]|uniref:Uncharacterized protein n=1 Tax=Pinibacter aurantiacus TaxID=2851599 RepID=A0A9E2S6H9_9BACT|nr:hypothetical protein [Pinibacter aurantiacus]MBV4356636.1 hypothetical protein [Pinibacter aurantiacus]